MQEYTQLARGERRLHHQEMRQKQSLRDTFFGLKNEPRQQRPNSVATEFMDTDWDDEDQNSEIEDNSPRISVGSVSIATALASMRATLQLTVPSPDNRA